MSKTKLFISFAADDNAKGSNSGGWVDNFTRYLTVYIQRINNQSVEVVPLQGTAKRPDVIGDSDGVILIVSQNYIKGNLAKADAPLLTDHSRVFKIDLSPIKKSAQPVEIRSLNEYHFFDSASGSDDYHVLGGVDSDQNFWLKIIDLAFEIDRTVYKKKRSGSEENRKKIYFVMLKIQKLMPSSSLTQILS